MREEILRLERVTCREQGVVQLENFNLQIFGEKSWACWR